MRFIYLGDLVWMETLLSSFDVRRYEAKSSDFGFFFLVDFGDVIWIFACSEVRVLHQ